MVQSAPTGLPRTASNHIDGSRVGVRSLGHEVSAIAIASAIAFVDHLLGEELFAVSVGSLEQVAPLIVVGMTGQYQVDTSRLQDGEEIFPHLNHSSPAVFEVVGVVSSLGVGRVVEEADFPVACGRFQIGFQPLSHGSCRASVRILRIQTDEMDVGVIERIIGLGPAGEATRLSQGGEGENVVIDSGLGW